MPVPRSRTERPRRSRPRGIVMPCSVNAASGGLGGQRAAAAALAARLDRVGAAGQRPLARGEEPGSITESASSITTASHSSARACSRPACRAAARPGSSSGAALEHQRAERAGDRRRRVGAAIGHDEHLVARPAVGRRSPRGSARSPRSSSCAGTRTRNRTSPSAAARLAVEAARRPPAVPRCSADREARQPDQDAEENDRAHRIRASCPRSARRGCRASRRPRR